jgi:hypothetical protein
MVFSPAQHDLPAAHVTAGTYCGMQESSSYCTVKGEGRCFPLHIMETCRGSRDIAPLILAANTRWRCMVNLTPCPLYSLEIMLVPFE